MLNGITGCDYGRGCCWEDLPQSKTFDLGIDSEAWKRFHLKNEPCSALDPVATLRVEDLMRDLTRDYTIAIVTHNMQQAARVSDYTAVMMMAEDRAGELVEFGPTRDIFTNPKDKRTEGYITGRFG